MAHKICYGCMRGKTQSPICEHCGFDERNLNLNHQLPIGTILNNQYVLGRVLGQGGFGITYIGWDRVLDMPVAVKEYFPNGTVYRNIGMGPNVQSYLGDDETVFQKHKKRFIREARSLAQLSAIPEIVQVKNFFEANNTAYIVMEYVNGITLKNYIKSLGRPLTIAETMQIMEPVIKGLLAVHERGLIHRDISPDNIMLQADGGIKIIDFGTVRYMNDAQRSKSTESVLKPGYAPMEQYNSKGNIGTWTDVYAICATICYCLSGEVPADAPSRLESGEELTYLEKIPGVSKQLVRILQKGMKIRLADRTATLSVLYNQLYKGVDLPDADPQKTYVETVPTQTSAGGTGNKVIKFVAVCAAAVLIICAGILFLTNRNEKTEQENSTVSTAGELPAVETAEQGPAWMDNVLMSCMVTNLVSDPSSDASQVKLNMWPVFNSTIPRSKICAVTFLDSTEDAPISAWDVSENQNGKVLAWVNKEGEMYHLYIAANGGINGEKSSEELFFNYRNLESVDFNGCYYSDNALSFAGMFNNCEKLQELDLGELKTGKALSMVCMFQGCKALEKLDISGFDTSRVKKMTAMFNGMFALKSLNLGDFNTEWVREYEMFYHAETLPDGTRWITLFEKD